MNAHINTLMQMTIGQIKEREAEIKRHSRAMFDIEDRNRETVASYLEQNKVKEKWAEDFLKEMEMEHI